MLAAAAVAVALPVPSAQADDGCTSTRCAERVARKACAKTRPVPCIRRAALHWHVPTGLQLAIARCEAGPALNPLAIAGSARNRTEFSRGWLRAGDVASGLMMIKPSTYRATPYRSKPLLSAKWNALSGAFLLRTQGTAPWAASRGCWG